MIDTSRRNALIRLALVVATVLITFGGLIASPRAEFLKSWTHQLVDPTVIRAERFYSVKELPNGEIVTVGALTTWAPHWFVAILKSDGTVKWQTILDEPLQLPVVDSGGITIVADPSGNPIVGYTCGSFSFQEPCIAKFANANGDVLWRKVPVPVDVARYCAVMTSDITGFFRICQTGAAQRLDWDGHLIWEVARPVSSKMQLPLTNGNLVVADYTVGPTLFQVHASANGAVIRESSVEGDILGSLALSSGDFLIHTQRAAGLLSSLSTLDRFSAEGLRIWRHDFPAQGASFSTHPIIFSNDIAVRHTVDSSGSRIQIATNSNGQFMWQRPWNPFATTLNIAQRIYEVNNGDFIEIDTSFGTVVRTVTVAGWNFSVYPQPSAALVARSGANVVGSVLEAFTPEIQHRWTASLFAIKPQLLVGNLYPADSQYVPRFCSRLRASALAADFELHLARREGINSNGIQTRHRRNSVSGELLTVTDFGEGAVCAATQRNGDGLFALGLDSVIRRIAPSGSVEWTASPEGAGQVYGSFAVELADGNIAVAAPTSSGASGWIYSPAGVALTARTSFSHQGISGLFAGANGDYYTLHNDSSVSHVSSQGTVTWNAKFGDTSCFYSGWTGGIRDLTISTNGDLLIAYRNCENVARVARTSPTGTVLWDQPLSVEPFSGPVRLSKVIDSSNGKIFVVGCVAPFSSAHYGTRSLVRAFSANGTAEWSMNIDVFASSMECATAVSANSGFVYVAVATDENCNNRSALLRISDEGVLEFVDANSMESPNVVASEMLNTNANSLIVAGNGYDPINRQRVSSVREVLAQGETCDFDLNGDGVTNINSDLVPTLRAMFGFSAATTSSAVATCEFSPEVTETRAKSIVGIAPFRRQSTTAADIDLDGYVNPLIDGTLLIRSLLGIPESGLTNGINFPSGATRTSPGEIATYLRSCRIPVAR